MCSFLGHPVEMTCVYNLIPVVLNGNVAHFSGLCVNCRGLMSRSIMQAQAASPTFTHVYAALVAVVNTKVSFSLLIFAVYLSAFTVFMV